ncbi:MAG: zinc-ribbon domain-containing protein, partial [Chloroflexota bacterium]
MVYALAREGRARVRCAACGTENRPDRKFCAQCGA